MRHLSAVIFIIMLVILPSCKYFKSGGLFGKKQKALDELLATQDSIRVADSLKKVQDHLLAMENARIDSLRRVEEERLAMESKYNIIVGAFITPEYAKGFADEYRKLGYDAQILKLEGTSFELVAAEGHKSFRTAVTRLNAFQDTVTIDAWLYIKK
jgi:hypothetical protein